MNNKFFEESGMADVVKREIAKREGKEMSGTRCQTPLSELVFRTDKGRTMSWSQGIRYIAGLISGDIR